MPQLLIALIAGAGIYAASRAVAKVLDAQAEANRQRAEARKRAAQAGHHPKDLGSLEYDSATGVYRPKATDA